MLAHDISNNRFSVILNNNDKVPFVSLYLHKKGPFHLTHETVRSEDNTALSLPQTIKTDSGATINLMRTPNAICISVDNELKVCCYEDSLSCSVAVTRFYTGKVNGLLGKTDQVAAKTNPNDWLVDKTCKVVPKADLTTKKDVVSKCSSLFDTPRMTELGININGWNQMCAVVTSYIPTNYGRMLKAFGEAARLQSITADIPSECYQCKNDEINFVPNNFLNHKDLPLMGNQLGTFCLKFV